MDPAQLADDRTAVMSFEQGEGVVDQLRGIHALERTAVLPGLRQPWSRITASAENLSADPIVSPGTLITSGETYDTSSMAAAGTAGAVVGWRPARCIRPARSI